ncbi:UDP-glucose 4-epimerase GalE [Kordiimonas pumila]|uniref:UDP-glucose 4-epimerase n=1 Tax=Kordiimonas pumila TaxID=2161677 RepID=A0ABV7D3F2_9PROT|nr:UDP-glucose 4-epimerase GalE [Kordiimonas pumila]
MTTVLIPGGAGFIGSHTVRALQTSGFESIILDNLSNGHKSSIPENSLFIEGDIQNRALLDEIFTQHKIDAVIHFAAFIEAGESVVNPLAFYSNNTGGTLCLLEAMTEHGIRPIVFSSTAAVYGQQETVATLSEDLPKKPINPYGESKWAVECMLRDTAATGALDAIALRYFNAAGSDPEGKTGELHDPETHLIPLVLQAASGKRSSIKVFGTDYGTPDGTCIRDYIHVCDLASAHVKALEHLLALGSTKGFYDAFNLGTGNGFSVRAVIESAKRVTGTDFAVVEEGRRAGDPAVLVADSSKARKHLGWEPLYPSLDDMVAHAWNFLKDR